MKSDSKLYRFFLGERGTRGLPTVAILIVLVPFLVFGFFFKNNKRENLANNPVSTRVAIEEIYSVSNGWYIDYHLNIDGISYKYYSIASKPIYFLSHDCTDSEFEKTMFDCLETSVKTRYEDMKASELIKAMKQQSWRQLYLNSTMCLVEYSSKEYLGDKLSIEVGKRRKDGRGFDWDSSRSRSLDIKKTDWRQTIVTIRNILESTINETDL